MLGRFEIVKTEDYRKVQLSRSCNNVYFVTGCVTQNGGNVVDARFLHCAKGSRLNTETNWLEMVHIIAFRMLVGVSDTNHSNILIGEGGRLYSVDENYVGSMTNEMILNTRAYKHLKKLLREKINNDRELVESHMPTWMFNEDERLKMLRLINAQGKKDGISTNILDRVAANSKGVGEKLMEFLFA